MHHATSSRKDFELWSMASPCAGRDMQGIELLRLAHTHSQPRAMNPGMLKVFIRYAYIQSGTKEQLQANMARPKAGAAEQLPGALIRAP
jgi:hypothetical protein